MTYNTPILMNVDTAFNVVLGVGIVDEVDHSTDKGGCPVTDNRSTTEGGCD